MRPPGPATMSAKPRQLVQESRHGSWPGPAGRTEVARKRFATPTSGRETFDRDELVQTWVVRHLERDVPELKRSRVVRGSRRRSGRALPRGRLHGTGEPRGRPRGAWSGTHTGVNSPLRYNRASFFASRLSVFTRSPGRTGTSVGATTTQATPIRVSCQYNT